MHNNISFIIPFKACNNERDTIFEWVKKRISILYPLAEKIVCDYRVEPFSRGRAINTGAKKATRDILVLLDADIIFDENVINNAIKLLENSSWVIPFTQYCTITAPDSERILKQKPDVILETTKPFKACVFNHTLGAINIIRRADFLKIGGFDERLLGWGFDDNVFAHKADVLLGKHTRLEGNIYHLYHSANRNWNDELTKKNKAIWEEIKEINNKEILLQYLCEVKNENIRGDSCKV
jgi:GT2 family glycosyltransferase